jgi:hypothetical protein
MRPPSKPLGAMNSQDLDVGFALLLLRRFGSRTFLGAALILGGMFVLWVAVRLPPVPQYMTVVVVIVGIALIVIGAVPVNRFLLTRKNPELD